MKERTPKFRIRIIVAFVVLSTLAVQGIANSRTYPIQEFGGIQPVVDKYEIDNSHSSVVFAVSHFGLSYTYGRFNEFAGEFSLEGGELTTTGFQFDIKADSIDTNQAERDKHLRGPEFFNTDRFPKISFVTTGFTKENGTYQITGDLTMLGQTQSIKMPVQLVGIGQGPFGAQRAGFFTKFTIKRDQFLSLIHI